jgi:uncharacterized protein
LQPTDEFWAQEIDEISRLSQTNPGETCCDALKGPPVTMNSMKLRAYPTSSERLAAMIAHGGALFAWILAPLIVYFVKRGESKYVEYHALQSLLWSLVGTLVSIATCGLAIPIFMIWHVLAVIRTSDGNAEDYEYPFVGTIAYNMVYAP